MQTLLPLCSTFSYSKKLLWRFHVTVNSVVRSDKLQYDSAAGRMISLLERSRLDIYKI